jgi:hypothetical protein
MKLSFSHLDLCYPNPLEVEIRFQAETEFEEQYLRSLSRLSQNGPYRLEWLLRGQDDQAIVGLILRKQELKAAALEDETQ